MVGAASGDGSRRVLPSWMLGVSSIGQASKSAIVEGSCEAEGVTARPGRCRGKKTVGECLDVVVDSEVKKRKRKSTEQDEDCEGGGALEKVLEKKGGGRGRRKVEETAVPDEQKAKAPRKGKEIHQKDTLGENSHILAKCQTKRSKSEKNEQGAELDDNIVERFSEKIGRGRRKVRESASLNWQEAKDSSGEEREVQTPSDHEVELTAEDLVTIAEEYIKADRNVEPEEAYIRECDLSSRLAEKVSISNKLNDHVDSRNSMGRSLVEDGTNSKRNGSLAGEEIATSSSRSGDPAQDMLDLFLGPWLKKPIEKETRTDILTDSLAFSYEIESQTHSRVVKEEVAPVTKKKSSLKDKVAMLLS